ncbi:MAG: MltA domain-containing protein [Magnetococcales bacterium]|nr:MltA domain-containing protein [Magnetococcales bacterium]
MKSLRGLLWIIMLLLAGCQSQQVLQEAPRPIVEPTPEIVDSSTDSDTLRVVSWSEIPPEVFTDTKLRDWGSALQQSAIYYGRIDPNKEFLFGTYKLTAAQLRQACRELAELAASGDSDRLEKVLKERYQLYRSVGGNSKGNVLVTGYYEPLLHGSTTPSKRYFYPIYRRPADLVDGGAGVGFHRLEKGKRVPYYSRAQIDAPFFPHEGGHKKVQKPEHKAKKAHKTGSKHKPPSKHKPTRTAKAKPKPIVGVLANRGWELLWVDNVIDAFFLHIQGSGRVLMSDGRMIRIGYDGANGLPFKAIGQILINEKQIPQEEMTMPRLRQWLVDHPREQRRLFFADASYVFFRELRGEAVGNINVPLTRDRSIATDHRLFPRGAPAILGTTLPNMAQDGKTVIGWRPETRLVVNQDTGGAIRGAGRVDLFFGFDNLIEFQAGVMKQNKSRLYFIAPRPGIFQPGG